MIIIWRNSVDRVHVRINTRPACRPPVLTYLLASDISFFFLSPPSYLFRLSIFVRSSRICIYARTCISKRYILGSAEKWNQSSIAAVVWQIDLSALAPANRIENRFLPTRFHPDDDGLRVDYAPRLWMQIEHAYWTDWRSFVSARGSIGLISDLMGIVITGYLPVAAPRVRVLIFIIARSTRKPILILGDFYSATNVENFKMNHYSSAYESLHFRSIEFCLYHAARTISLLLSVVSLSSG